jgi:type IV pilus modification protein PilV
MHKSGNKFRTRGFSLIEVLISMLILAFGVLSMGGLQLASLRSSQSSASFSTAGHAGQGLHGNDAVKPESGQHHDDNGESLFDRYIVHSHVHRIH